MNGVHQALDVAICADAHEAIQRGFFYRAPVFLPIRIERVVVVQKGTAEGGSTVDLILVDEKGQKYAALLTGNLLKSIPC